MRIRQNVVSCDMGKDNLEERFSFNYPEKFGFTNLMRTHILSLNLVRVFRTDGFAAIVLSIIIIYNR